MTPAPTPAKFLKTTCDSHLAEWRNTEIFSLNFLIPTTCHSKKLKFRPPMENPRPALRGDVDGRGAPKRPPAFIPHFFRPPVFVVTQVLHTDARSVSALSDRHSAGWCCSLCIAALRPSALPHRASPFHRCTCCLLLSRCTRRRTGRSISVAEALSARA